MGNDTTAIEKYMTRIVQLKLRPTAFICDSRAPCAPQFIIRCRRYAYAEFILDSCLSRKATA
jgi:hypothetical protein